MKKYSFIKNVRIFGCTTHITTTSKDEFMYTYSGENELKLMHKSNKKRFGRNDDDWHVQKVFTRMHPGNVERVIMGYIKNHEEFVENGRFDRQRGRSRLDELLGLY